MSEFSTVDRESVVVLPEGFDLRLGALVEPLAVAWRAAGLTDLTNEDRAVIVGGGAVGFGTWLALRAHGVNDVIVIEPSDARRRALLAAGAQVVSPPDHRGNPGIEPAADAVVVAAGTATALSLAIELTRSRGRIVHVAIHESPVMFDPNQIVQRQLSLFGAFGYDLADFADVIDFLGDGRITLAPWVEEIAPWEVVHGLQQLRNGTAMKLLVNCDAFAETVANPRRAA